ncbi:hypothetical protein [Streptomyces sp. DH10]|uniref:hypothetical protein n=1 Tax=Streptomyces sp. DH10 TaxID=3040121 RepID=UPI00244248B3|nr:hypothetical protein [Streptomyces sp. DH10]MDG9709642.1 hypothetical protein [Streptomyces sp. DH10]
MTAEPQADRLLVAELVGVLNDAEHYVGPGSGVDSRLAYLDRRAALLHRIVDALGDEASRYLAQDAEDRAQDARSRAEIMAQECGDPAPAPTAVTRRTGQAPRKS